nr:reverse transcriptase domain-containing protein [Tanacetum cinerariifolium]
MDLRKRLGSKRVRNVSGSLESRRGRSESPMKRDPERKMMFRRLEKGVFHRLGEKVKSMSAYSNDLRHQLYHSRCKNTEQSSRSRGARPASKKHHNKRTSSYRTEALSDSKDGAGEQWKSRSKNKDQALRMTIYPSHSEDPEDHLKIFQAATKVERWAMPTWCHMFNSTLTRSARVWFDDLPSESVDSYDDLKEAFLVNFLQKKKCIKDLVEIHHIKQREGKSTKDFVRRIIGRPRVKKIQTVPSTAHGMLKFPVVGGILTLKSSKIIPIECATVSGPEGHPSVVNQSIKEIIKEGCPPVRQKKRGQAADRNHAIQEKVRKLVDADGLSCVNGSRAGLILTNPEGIEFTYALRFRMFSIKQVPRSENKKADALSKIASTSFAHLCKQVLVEELKEKSINEVKVLAVVKKEGDTWMTPIYEFLTKETLPAECVGPLQSNYVLREIHEGSCSMHEGTRSIVAKALQTGYYWPIMHKDARTLIRECQECQVHRPVLRNPQQKLTPTTSPWSFYKRGIDIAGPFLKGPEMANQSLGEGIKARLDAKSKNWMKEISHVLWAHRTMIKSSNGDTPFSLTYRTEVLVPTEIGMPTLMTAKVDMVQNDEALKINMDLLEEKREHAAIREARSKVKMENTTTQRSAAQVSNQETSCTVAMMQAMRNKKES